MAQIEILLDESTLPQDDQKVRFHLMETDTEHVGTYCKDDQLFYIDDTHFYSAFRVDSWEPITE